MNLSFATILLMLMIKSTTQPICYDWDFSQSHHIDQVPWPKGKRPQPDLFYNRPVREKIAVRFSPEFVFERYVERITFSKQKDLIVYIDFNLEKQSVADAYSTAKELSEKYGLPIEPIEAWKKSIDAGRPETALTARRDIIPTIDLEIFESFDEEKPKRIVFRIGWPSINVAQPSTAPTTNAAERK